MKTKKERVNISCTKIVVNACFGAHLNRMQGGWMEMKGHLKHAHSLNFYGQFFAE